MPRVDVTIATVVISSPGRLQRACGAFPPSRRKNKYTASKAGTSTALLGSPMPIFLRNTTNPGFHPQSLGIVSVRPCSSTLPRATVHRPEVTFAIRYTIDFFSVARSHRMPSRTQSTPTSTPISTPTSTPITKSVCSTAVHSTSSSLNRCAIVVFGQAGIM